ncbi:MAG: MFS transporter [Brachybacterium sp.]|uniref:MFS transporter n=1 Tax=Brachybacterium sp. TaxID=1891286 RepID=UPI00264DA1D4|nr:MFS transporter [Brachybacterium sp.]MDN6301652.1 MFS transporter [Brachybacterium sp.]MDN6328510.1 MFS transporter [Brachybacterium sp.]
MLPALDSTVSPARATARWWALAVLMLPVLLVAVDNTVLAFALPAISEALTPSGQQLLWIVDIYPLILAGLLVPMGSLGDRLGRRRLLLIGGSGFTLISALAAFSPTAGTLIAARALMGLFGAMLMPATLSLIRNIFTDPTQRRTAIAIWAAGFSGGAALGPLLGGLLLEHFAWGAVFLLAVPVMLPLLLLGPLLIPESKDPAPGPVDPVSVLLALATMTPLVYAIKRASTSGVDVFAIVCAAIAVLCGVAFVRRQLARPVPMLDVTLFTRPVFSGAVAANLLSVFSLVGFLYFVSQHLQLVSGRSPLEAGLLLLPGLVVTIIAGLLVVRLVRHITPATAVVAGLCLNATGFVLVMVAGAVGGDLTLLIAFAVLGAGVGTAETISNDLILSAVPAERAGAASAISETAYETGAVLGTAVLGSLLNAAYRSHLEVPAGLTAPQHAAASETLGGATAVAAELPARTGQALLDSAQHAFDSGAVLTSGIGAGLMVIAALIAHRTLRR